MGTVQRIDDRRGVAVRRHAAGESVRSIAASLGRSRQWVYKWLTRAVPGRSTGQPTGYGVPGCRPPRSGRRWSTPSGWCASNRTTGACYTARRTCAGAWRSWPSRRCRRCGASPGSSPARISRTGGPGATCPRGPRTRRCPPGARLRTRQARDQEALARDLPETRRCRRTKMVQQPQR